MIVGVIWWYTHRCLSCVAQWVPQVERKELSAVAELAPQELEALVRELAEESEEEESLSPEVEELLRNLQQANWWRKRRWAAEHLGELSESSSLIVRSLLVAGKFDSSLGVREAAIKSLRAPVHQQYVRRLPDLLEAGERDSQQDDLGTEAREYVEYRRVKPDSNRNILLVIPAAVVVAGIGLANISDSAGWWLLILGAILLAGWVLWEFRTQENRHNVFTRSMIEAVVVVDRVYTQRYEMDSDYDSGSYYRYFVVVYLPPDDKFDPGFDYHLIMQVSEEIWFPLDCGSKVRIRYAAEDPRIALIEGEWRAEWRKRGHPSWKS